MIPGSVCALRIVYITTQIIALSSEVVIAHLVEIHPVHAHRVSKHQANPHSDPLKLCLALSSLQSLASFTFLKIQSLVFSIQGD